MAKSQTSLEYLMTYGWAILILIIVIGTLYALGLTQPCRWVGIQVREFADFKVENPKMTIDSLSFDLSYQRDSAKLHDIILSGDASSIGSSPLAGTSLSSIAVRVSTAISTSKVVNDCYKIEVTIQYNKTTATGEETFTSLGKISGLVQSQGFISNIICQNAANGELCEGLDIAYGDGYRAFCCSEYGLCC